MHLIELWTNARGKPIKFSSCSLSASFGSTTGGVNAVTCFNSVIPRRVCVHGMSFFLRDFVGLLILYFTCVVVFGVRKHTVRDTQ